MEVIHRRVRQSTPDCPLYVLDYAPAYVREDPSFIQSTDRLVITLMYRGQVEVSVGGTVRILDPGDIYIIRPHDPHTFRTMTMDTRYVTLGIGRELLALPEGHFFQEGFVRPLWEGKLDLPRLFRPGDEGYDDLFRELSRVDMEQEGKPGYAAQLFSIVIAVCTRLMSCCVPAKEPRKHTNAPEDIVRRCVEYINENYARKLALEELAAHVHLHPNYLCGLFKRHTGISVFEHLNRYRLRRASRLLSNTGLPISQVAEQCGFPNASFFALKFRQRHGCSPTEYRQRFATPAIPLE